MGSKIYICVLVVYFVIVYGGEACHYFYLTPTGYMLLERSGDVTSYMTGIVVIHCIMLGWLADSYCGRFQVFVLTLVFMAVSILTVVMCLLNGISLATKKYLFLASRMFDGMYFTFGGLLYVIFLEQLHLSEEFSSIKFYTFIYYEIFLIASFLNQKFSNVETAEFTIGKLIFIAVLLGIISILTIKFHSLITVEPVYFRIIENCITASYVALTNKFKKRESLHDGNGHWIYRARPQYPDIILDSTRQYLHQIKVLVFSGVFTCFYSLNISTMKIQANLIGRTFHANLNLTLPDFLKLLTILCLPFTEFVLIPMMKACTMFKRDLHFIGIGFFLLLTSMIYSTYLQITLQRHSFALPARDAGQLRIYNSLPEHINLTTQYNESLQIQPYGLLSMLRLYGRGRISRRFTVRSSTINQTRYLSTESGQSYTVVVTKKGLSLSYMPDALFYFMLKTNISNFMFTMVLLVHKEHGDGYLTFARHKGEIYILHVNPAVYQPFILVRAGKYQVAYRDNVFPTFLKLDTNAEFTVGGIYSLFIYRNATSDLVAKVFTIMNPIVIHWKYLIPQVICSVLAYCFNSLSWLKFMFLEAPVKLRTASYCFLVVCGELLTNAIALESNFLDNVHYADALYLSIGFLLSSLVLFIYVATNYTYVGWKS